MQVPDYELQMRMTRFRDQMDEISPSWEIAIFVGKINLYYFTGTIQEGMLIVPRNDEAIFWVKRSFERAQDESLFPVIRQMNSYKDAAHTFKHMPHTVFLEMEIMPMAMYQRIIKHFPFAEVKPLDFQINSVRAIKSDFELNLMEQAGAIHQRVLEIRVPRILHAGISEAGLASDIYSLMIEEGHHGVVRFGMFDTEMVLGHIAFGESSLYPTSFNGPGGNYGLSPAVPSLGSRLRKLNKGDLIFVDIGCGVDGYHTDKTMTYIFNGSLPPEVVYSHQQCVDIQNEIASMLIPGAIPSEIYNTIIKKQKPEFLENFMGFGNRQVRFLGHGIGLTIDELPVIAPGFDEPLQKGMVFALEPKKGIEKVGMVGIENTFVVTPDGGRSITGAHPGLLKI